MEATAVCLPSKRVTWHQPHYDDSTPKRASFIDVIDETMIVPTPTLGTELRIHAELTVMRPRGGLSLVVGAKSGNLLDGAPGSYLADGSIYGGISFSF